MKKAWNKYWERAENFNTISDAQEAIAAEKHMEKIKKELYQDMELRTVVSKQRFDIAKQALQDMYEALRDKNIDISDARDQLDWDAISKLPHQTQQNIKIAIDTLSNAQKNLSDVERQVHLKWEPYTAAAFSDFEKKSSKLPSTDHLGDILQAALDKDYSDEPATDGVDKKAGDEEAAEPKKETYRDKVGKKSYFCYVLPYKATTTFTPSNALQRINDAACYAWYNKGAVWDHKYKVLGAAAAIAVCAYAYKNPKIISSQNLEVVSKKMLDVSSKGFEQLVKGVDRCVQGLRWLAR